MDTFFWYSSKFFVGIEGASQLLFMSQNVSLQESIMGAHSLECARCGMSETTAWRQVLMRWARDLPRDQDSALPCICVLKAAKVLERIHRLVAWAKKVRKMRVQRRALRGMPEYKEVYQILPEGQPSD